MKTQYLSSLLLFFFLFSYHLDAQNFETQFLRTGDSGSGRGLSSDFMDYDGDGKLDIIGGFPNTKYLLNMANQGVGFRMQTEADTVRGYYYIKKVDLNQDGFDDFLAEHRDNNLKYHLVLHLNTGNYQYQSYEISFPLNDPIDHIEIADMDNDGDLDLVVDMKANLNYFYYLKQETNFQFSWSFVSFSGQPATLYGLADFDEDGLMDVVARHRDFSINDDVVTVMEADTNLTEGFISHVFDTLRAGTAVVANFVGSDEKEILISPLANTTQAFLWQHDGNFSFSLLASPSLADKGNFYLPNDYDGDGDIDVLLKGTRSAYALIQNDGGGTFTTLDMGFSNFYPAKAWEDVTGDGRKDLLIEYSVYDQQTDGSYELYWNSFDMGASSLQLFDKDQNNRTDVLSVSGTTLYPLGQSYEENFSFQQPYIPSGLPDTYPDASTAPDAIFQIDKDGDQDIDLLMAHKNNLYWLNNSGGSFSATLAVSGLSPNFTIRNEDLDEDGNPDILVSASTLERFEWNGNNFMQSTMGFRSNLFAAGDWDLDGDKDIAYLIRNQTSRVAELWYAQNTNNIYSNVYIQDVTETSGRIFSSLMKAEDLDSDGDLDLIFANEFDNEISWLRNDSNLVFTDLDINTTIIDPGIYQIADFDGDNKKDIVVGSNSQGKVFYLSNNGSEVFTESILIEDIPLLAQLEIEDLDQDGDQDVIASSRWNARIVWMKNMEIDCPRTYASLTESICLGDSFLLGNTWIFDAGMYTDTIPNTNACDSLIRLELSTYQLDNFVLTADSSTVYAISGLLSYEWFRNDTLLTSEMKDSLDAALYGSGIYQVKGRNSDGCYLESDTLSVQVENGVGIDESINRALRVFPNPVEDMLVIRSDFPLSLIEDLQLTSLDGRQIQMQELYVKIFPGEVKLDLSNLKAGIYLLSIEIEDQWYIRKLIKE
ncbi:MAG: T9SS type A sorting domain-containing protein [Bacteroidia bacterium]|nr:T9SS type A sorting domain-containing protein [Bacteroidia bacterium]